MRWQPNTPQPVRESPQTLALRIAVRALREIDDAIATSKLGTEGIGRIASRALFEIQEIIR